jgi:colicin import membrane protein
MLDHRDAEKVTALLLEAGETVRLAREHAATAEARALGAERGRAAAEERAQFAEARSEGALRAAEELGVQVSEVAKRVQAIEAHGLELRRHAEARVAVAEVQAQAAERRAAERIAAAEVRARRAEERLNRVRAALLDDLPEAPHDLRPPETRVH